MTGAHTAAHNDTINGFAERFKNHCAVHKNCAMAVSCASEWDRPKRFAVRRSRRFVQTLEKSREIARSHDPIATSALLRRTKDLSAGAK